MGIILQPWHSDAASAFIRSLMFLCRNDLTYKLQHYSLNYYIIQDFYYSRLVYIPVLVT
jgi:hypothetical protein